MTSTNRDRVQELQPSDVDALRRRVQQLLRQSIDFIPNSEFEAVQPGPDRHAYATATVDQPADNVAVDLPAHLRRLCEKDLLTHEQESSLFRSMNLLKFQAASLRSELDADNPDPHTVQLVERLLAEAHAMRDHIIEANMRLVISIVKKFVTPQHTFDDMLSDGTVTLMQAVEKFDFARGFRFSTYAYRSIARTAYRSVSTANKECSRFARDAEEWAFEQEEDRSSSPMSDNVWSNLRELTTAMLHQLDRRERFIIRSRYALGSHRKVRTFQYLADKLGISKERARQLERRAVQKLTSMASEYQMDDLFAAAMV